MILPIIGTLVLVLIAWVWYLFNRLVRSRNAMDQAWRDVDAKLSLRRESIPALLEAVHGHGDMEKSILVELSSASGSDAQNDITAAQNRFSEQLTAVIKMAENYPAISGSANFHGFCRQLGQVEEEIRNAAKLYNSAVSDFNKLLDSFPTNIIAEKIDYHSEKRFQMEFAIKHKL